MTIAQLIEELKNYDPNAYIAIKDLRALNNAVSKVDKYEIIEGYKCVELYFSSVDHIIKEITH